MRLETKRLTIYPLSADELALWLDSPETLEGRLNISYDAETVDDWFRKIIAAQIGKTSSDPENFFYHTFWWIIENETRRVVGSCDFKAPPENGRVEIGYGLGEKHFHKGFMTETVKALCDFAFSKGVSEVIAKTELDNIASQNVLKRCGFEIYKQGGTLWWSRKN